MSRPLHRLLPLLGLLLALPAAATSIKQVRLLRDDAGEPGARVEMFAPGQHVQHFEIEIDGLKLGAHDFVIGFHADETTAGSNQKILDVETSTLVANRLSAQISLPRDWPSGWYRLEVRMDGQPIGTHRYIVSVPWAEQRIVAWRLLGADAAGRPAAEVPQFAPGQHTQHFEIETNGYLKRGAVLRYVYRALDTEAGRDVEVARYDFTVPNDPQVFNILTSQVSLERDWPRGRYRLSLHEGERLLGEHDYEVR